MMTEEQEPFPLDPNDPDAGRDPCPARPLPPAPLIDEDVLAAERRSLVESFLREHPYFAWRNSNGYIANDQGKYRKFSRRTYYQLIADHMAAAGYQRRGLMHELVADRVRTALAARDL